MTVIAGFYSPKSRRAYLGSDNLSLPAGNRVDKIQLLYGRFAVAVYGSDVVMFAINALRGFDYNIELSDGTRFGAAESLRTLLDRIEAVLPACARKKYKLYQDFTKSAAGKEYYAKYPPSSTSTLIVLDSKVPTLYQAMVTNLIPPQDSYKITAAELAPDKWHTWPPNLPTGTLDLKTARETLGQAIDAASRIHGPHYGSAGCEVRVSSGPPIYRTDFSSLADFIEEDAKQPAVSGP